MQLTPFINLSEHKIDLDRSVANRVRLHKGRNYLFAGYNNKISIEYLREINSGDSVDIHISFIGHLVVKVGLWRDGYSYAWLAEKNMKAAEVSRQSIAVDISDYEFGNLEVKILALDYSDIFVADTSSKADTVESFRLQNFISPSFELCSEIPLYYKLAGETAHYSFENKYVALGKNDALDLLTYFNAFSAGKWQKHTNVDSLTVSLDFSGRALVVIVHIIAGRETILDAFMIKSDQRTALTRLIGDTPKTGLLGCKIYAREKILLYGGGFGTDCPATQDVKLGISITTYKRETTVKKTVSRLTQAIKEHPAYNQKITLTVVDNGQTLAEGDLPGATLIPNRNLGGAGGFTRGLIHYQDEGAFTHCLFMDDDACCEAESIFRSIAFLEHANDDSSAISGAMLSENVRFIQWENGAYFNFGCHPIGHGLDCRDTVNLIKNECPEDTTPAVYSGWWFFMFPIKHVTMYAFPFFVRGDDVEFSYLNKFNIVRMNGIASWQETFKAKESPLTLYLDTRSYILHHIHLDHLSDDRVEIIKMVWHFFTMFNNSYQYDTANAIALAFNDILAGPKYWIDNIDTKEIRKRITQKYTIEILKQYDDLKMSAVPSEHNLKTKLGPKFFRKYTLNGHLMPGFMIEKKTIWRMTKDQMPNSDRIYLRDKIYIIDEINKKGYILQRSPRYFFTNIVLMLIATIKLFCRFNSVKYKYLNFLNNLKTNTFWGKLFLDGKNHS